MKEKVVKICDTVIEWSFYVLLAGVTFSTSLVEIAASLMMAAWALKKAIDRDFSFLKEIPFKVLVLYFLWVILSCFNSEYFKESFRGVFKVGEYLILFIITATFLWNNKSIKRFIYISFSVVSFTCINGIFQYFTGEDAIRHRQLITDDYLRRISSSFVHPNDFGVYLLVVSIIFISILLVKGTKLRERLPVIGAVVLSLICLLMTRSRGAWISFSAAFLVLGALKARKFLAIFLAVLLVMFIMLPYTVQEQIFAITNFQSGTTWERLMLWKGTINMIEVHPFLGFGINTYSRNFPKYRPPEYPDIRYTHNSYLHMASEVGIIGALLFIIFLVSVFVNSFFGIQAMSEDRKRNLSLGLFAALIGFALNSIVDTHLYSVNLAVFFNLMLGFFYSLCHQPKNE